MSNRNSGRRDRDGRHLCAECRARKANYQYRGHVRADRQHVLCFQCFRAARERMRAQELSQLPFGSAQELLSAPARLNVSAPSAPQNGSLTAKQVEHRQQMLAFLASQQAPRSAQR